MQATSGFMHITGEPDGAPTKVGYAVTDVLTGQHLTTGILAACMQRERSAKTGFKGEGQHVTTSMIESALYSLSYVTSSYLNGGFDYGRTGNRHSLIAPYSVYKTGDNQWIVLGVATDKQFETLKQVIGLQDPENKFSSNASRLKNRESLDSEINRTL